MVLELCTMNIFTESTICPLGATKGNHGCYYVEFENKLTLAQADEYCFDTYNGHLVKYTCISNIIS